jgi:chorismate dehydratase
MAIKVGRCPYLHCEPFYFDMNRRGIETYEMVPSAMATAVESGELDGGLVPLVDCFRLEDHFQPVVGFCIACGEQSGSVFLYSKKPIEELNGIPIAVTDEANTAPKLLEVLLKLKYGVEPGKYTSLEEQPFDAFLLVGNRALRLRRGARGFPYKYDLGQEWNSWTGLPFVFSRWIARKDMDSKELALLEDTLYVGLEDGVDALYHLNEPRDELLMLPRDVVNHLQTIRYFMGLSEQKAVNQFREYLKQLDG